ncbi:sensor histidine kinase [Streptomyces sp. SID5785]|uniref:sensor histidine kinase n=1 Tax=Streptomyces sp. SID5785 TaxID=2690309 RepID=UPI00136195B4|nr:sensor domain-containing protein [Streptomyces sp. SID5785]MZD10207.1 sensor histidine kinase [Streptomyces sp. SID5785]
MPPPTPPPPAPRRLPTPPWRAAAYLGTGVLCGALTLLALLVTAVAGGVLALVLVGLPLLAAVALAGLPVAALERRRLRLVDPRPVPPDPHGTPHAPGPWGWLRTRVRERATWRELGHALLFATVLWPLDALALAVTLVLPAAVLATPLTMAVAGDGQEARVVKLWTVTSWPGAWASALLGLLLLALGAVLLSLAGAARAALARLLLTTPTAELDARVVELTRSRARLVDAFEAERRRIERDLHDGAQQRLVALTMALGLARLDAPPDGPLAAQLARAQHEAEQTLSELRALIHGIHPQVLTDYGLAAALTDAADRSPVPVDVRLDLPGRPPRAVESAAWFVAAEALANIARHSGAAHAEITGRHDADRLVLVVRDDGRGGADPAAGTGLTGLADRVAVLGGRLTLTSPPGGPTLLRVELPCPLTPVPCG